MKLYVYTKKGKCTPRLCGRERVFVERTGLCHDIEDPMECTGGRRLYYNAFGTTVCACPVGQVPFPGPLDNCVQLFKQGNLLFRTKMSLYRKPRRFRYTLIKMTFNITLLIIDNRSVSLRFGR